ncbi:hypothetical protein [Sulfuriroseicoccus oceanibius]|uniref:Uncharacterized protein n=1 Tax=Sulfuriroseicoccus oceanibius TaxID=2707525 RepID=A0A6B3LCG6_9BACT|nr:hypothetical protein [Sulfuriroseicoccus oceanibius]QQL45053.1 hypothetical protein G3M56_000245 [Sulfuriroseicoccus oceanibius]
MGLRAAYGATALMWSTRGRDECQVVRSGLGDEVREWAGCPRANKEDGVTGVFWQACFKSQRLDDEGAVVAAAVRDLLCPGCVGSRAKPPEIRPFEGESAGVGGGGVKWLADEQSGVQSVAVYSSLA